MDKQTIRVKKVDKPKEKPNPNELEFGRIFTDHMFVMDYNEENGWHDPRIVPYEPISIDPSAIVLHYGQTVFEGLKAYMSKDGQAQLFRPEQNFKRLNRSNARLCIPPIDESFALHALKQLIALEKDWIPSAPGTSLYIRPFIIGTEPFLGVAPAKTYQFYIILSPVGAYYEAGINPVKIAVEDKYVRAVVGGTGEAKTGGNYAASLIAQEKIDEEGFAQVLWLDGVEKKYIEEVGSMNVFFKINGEVVTPKLAGSILAGITRKSVIQLLDHWDIPFSERKIMIDELYEAYQNGQLEEAFGTGTAAVISPIGQLSWQGKQMIINNEKTGPVAKKLYDTITSIQNGSIDDPFDWITVVHDD